MAMTRRTSALPIPQQELDRLRANLPNDYGSLVWEGAGERILVVRVPRPDPDLVTDVEASVDRLMAEQVQGLTAALLVGDAKAMAVAVHPFQDLMQRRVAFDATQGQELRKRLAPGSHVVYRAPGDHRRVVRLALRLRKARVADLDEAELDQWTPVLATDLSAGKLQGVRAVYVIADQDDVRVDAATFLDGIRQRMADADERRRIAAELAAKQATMPKPRAAQAPRVAYAPLRSIADASATDASLDASAGLLAGTATPDADGPQAPPSPASADASAQAAPANPLADALRAQLVDAGFDVIVNPSVKHRIDLAAERADGDVQRVIVRLPERLTADVAQDVLAMCRAVDTDLALIICQDADPDGRKRLIATKARWIQPGDVQHLRL